MKNIGYNFINIKGFIETKFDDPEFNDFGRWLTGDIQLSSGNIKHTIERLNRSSNCLTEYFTGNGYTLMLKGDSAYLISNLELEEKTVEEALKSKPLPIIFLKKLLEEWKQYCIKNKND